MTDQDRTGVFLECSNGTGIRTGVSVTVAEERGGSGGRAIGIPGKV